MCLAGEGMKRSPNLDVNKGGKQTNPPVVRFKTRGVFQLVPVAAATQKLGPDTKAWGEAMWGAVKRNPPPALPQLMPNGAASAQKRHAHLYGSGLPPPQGAQDKMQQMEEFVLLFLLRSFYAASRYLTIQCHIRLLRLTHNTPLVRHPKSVGVLQVNKTKPNLELNIYELITSTP